LFNRVGVALTAAAPGTRILGPSTRRRIGQYPKMGYKTRLLADSTLARDDLARLTAQARAKHNTARPSILMATEAGTSVDFRLGKGKTERRRLTPSQRTGSSIARPKRLRSASYPNWLTRGLPKRRA
jgi:hypothetical protein